MIKTTVFMKGSEDSAVFDLDPKSMIIGNITPGIDTAESFTTLSYVKFEGKPFVLVQINKPENNK